MAAALILAVALYTSCKDDMEGKTFQIYDDVMMDDYITQKDMSMSSFLQIVDRAGFRGMVHAYGTYTCFAPDNNAIATYLQENNLSSIADMTESQCVDIVKYHILREVYATSDFIDGRLPTATMLAKFITTRTVGLESGAVIQVNRQAYIVEKDIQVANGYIHKVDRVLSPHELNCGEQIMALPDDYSLFKQVMQETGWVDTLKNNNEGVWYSVFLQSNASLAAAGITTRESLITYLKNNAKLDFTEDARLLWTYAAYHCVKGLFYIADLANTSSLISLAPSQAIMVKSKLDTILINEYKSTTKFEKGIPIDKQSEYTDFSCFNGVLQDLTGYIGPVKRGAQSVFWDVAEQPELLKDSRFRKSGIDLGWDFVKTFSEMKLTLASGQTTTKDWGYSTYSAYDPKNAHANQDALAIGWYRVSKVEFTMPMLTEGTYKVWVCYRRADVQARVRGIFSQVGQEDQTLNIIEFTEYFSTSTPAEVLRAAGWKRYTAKERNSTMCSRELGTIVVQSTGRHTLTFNVVDRGRTGAMWMDMIHFIPVEDDQLWPRFDMKGNMVFQTTPCEEIWPQTQACSADNESY